MSWLGCFGLMKFSFCELIIIFLENYGERTNCMHHNRGILTVGLKPETVEIIGIIFLPPQPPKPTVLEKMFCCQNFIKTTVVLYTTLHQIKYVFVEWKRQSISSRNVQTIPQFQLFFKSITNTFTVNWHM